MEVQLKEVISRLKDEGIEAAQNEAQQIIEDANVEAQKIISAAGQQAEKLRKQAEEDALRFEKSGTESVKQAGRDLVLLVKDQISKILTGLLSDEVGKALSGNELARCISDFVGRWQPTEEYSVILSEDEAARISAALITELRKKAGSTVVDIRPLPDVDAGFKIAIKQGAVVLDFSQQEVTRLLSQLLNARFAELIK